MEGAFAVVIWENLSPIHITNTYAEISHITKAYLSEHADTNCKNWYK